MRRDDAYLLDMLIAARDASGFLAGLPFERYQASRLHQLAALKALENIGEAAGRVSEQTRLSHPEIPWREITGLRPRRPRYFGCSG